MKTNNYTPATIETLSDSAQMLIKKFGMQLKEILQEELKKMKAIKELATKQMAA